MASVGARDGLGAKSERRKYGVGDGNGGLKNLEAGLTVTAGEAGTNAESISTAASIAGVGATFGDVSYGGTWLGTNGRLYQGPRGNQYFFTFLKLGTAFKVAGLGALTVGTFADYYTAQETGAYFQANFNLSLGLLGIAVPPLAIPTSIYGVVSSTYPRGQAAYNQSLSAMKNAAEGGGP